MNTSEKASTSFIHNTHHSRRRHKVLRLTLFLCAFFCIAFFIVPAKASAENNSKIPVENSSSVSSESNNKVSAERSSNASVESSTSDPEGSAAAGGLKTRYIRFEHSYRELDHPETTQVRYSEEISDGRDYWMTVMYNDFDNVIKAHATGASDDQIKITLNRNDIMSIDKNGNLTMKDAGSVLLTAEIEADDEYAACTAFLQITIQKYYGFLVEAQRYTDRSYTDGLDLDTSDGPHQLYYKCREGAVVEFTTDMPHIIDVDENGVVTPLSPGRALIFVTFDNCDNSDEYEPFEYWLEVHVTGSDTRKPQSITGTIGPLVVDIAEPYALDLHAETALSYRSSDTAVATVSSDGVITFKKEGFTAITVQAADSKEYMADQICISVTGKDFAAEQKRLEEEAERARLAAEREKARQEAEAEAERQEAEAKAAYQAKLAKAKSLAKPKLTCKRSKKKNKLTWSKVAGCDGYELYIKYPGSKKYKKAVSRDATVKSVTHRGLTRKKKYSYKVRSFAVVNGKKYYGPFSKAVTVKVK